MNNGYSVDEILNEIQLKRSSSNGGKPNIEFKRESLNTQLSGYSGFQNAQEKQKNTVSAEPSAQNLYKQQNLQPDGQDLTSSFGSLSTPAFSSFQQKSMQNENAEPLFSQKPAALNNLGVNTDADEIRNTKLMFDPSYFKIGDATAKREQYNQGSFIGGKNTASNEIFNNSAMQAQDAADAKEPSEPVQQTGRAAGFKFKVNLPDNISDDLPTQMNIPIQQKPAAADIQATRHIDLSYGFSSNSPQQTDDFASSRIQKKQEFAMQDFDGEEENEYEITGQPESDSEDDYNSPDDKASVLSDIRSVKISLFLRLVFSGLAFVLLTYLSFAADNTFMPLPKLIWPEENMKLFLTVNAAVLAATTLICNATIISGISGLFKLKPNNDTSAALAVMITLIQGTALIFQPDRYTDNSVHIYLSIAAMSLFFNAVGKMMLVNRISRNFDVVSSDGEKLAFSVIKDEDTAREFARGQNIDQPLIAYTARAGFLSSFLTESYSEDYNEGFFGKTVTAMSLMGSIMVSLTTILIKGDIYFALTTFSALMCVCSAISTTLTSNLPLDKASSSLARINAQIAGYSSVEKYSDVNALVIDSTQLFPENSVILHGLKVFDQSKIDKAIIDAASVVCCCKNHLRGIFLNVLDGNESMLKAVDSVVFEDGLGISAWVDGKRVLIGNRDLMLHHGIETPTKEFELKFIRDGREVLYLSNSGQLICMFVVSYNKTEEIEYELNRLAKRKVSLLVYCTDPNLTAAKISEIYNFPAESIKVLPSKLHGDCNKLARPVERASSAVVLGDDPINVFRVLNAVFAVRSASVASTLIQFIGIIIGYAIISYFAFAGDLSLVTFSSLMVYQLFWAVVSVIIPNFKRY